MVKYDKDKEGSPFLKTLSGCILIDISRNKFDDKRGYFVQLAQSCPEINFERFKQINTSFSHKNVVRGMHNQVDQEKLVYVVSGKILDYVIKIGSTKDNQFLLTPNNYMLYVPADCVHGFLALEDSHVVYLTTAEYNPKENRDINPLCPDYSFPWRGMKDAIISDKDKAIS